MFRSGRLTEARVDQIVKWVERMPHNLRAVAKACRVYPPDLLAWYAAGQDLECTDRWMVQLAWEIDRIRADKAARNYERLETLADTGHFQAIEKLESLGEASPWEICPTGAQAAELHAMMRELAPTPLLTHGTEPRAVHDHRPAGPIAGSDGVGEVELPDGAGQVPADVGVPEVQGTGGGDRLDAVQGVRGQVDVQLDGVLHTQSMADPEGPCKT